ncbi:hypothetical protein LTR15_000318 [Elasticomyces elasticus]|nr:hypothetical protein LTR15_000318 [Elasticomyces elasticus]
MAASSHLLALPRELRNLIYEFIVVDEETLRIKQTPSPMNHCQLAPSSSVLLACKQINAEYLETLLKNTLDSEVMIEAVVINLDTARLRHFVRMLTPAQLRNLHAGPRLQMKLVFTTVVSEHDTEKNINQWSMFCDEYSISAKYEVDDTVGWCEINVCMNINDDNLLPQEEEMSAVLIAAIWERVLGGEQAHYYN